ncbi:MAG TPA: 2-dehydropantoate 2-reductase [Anaerolineae bacterium]|nr:2-dehydropantoate 2-reductase [Anaerolineae bacterium]
MKIAIFGTGGVGGYFGGLLARAGHEVAFIARGAHLQALRDKGLKVRSVHGDFDIPHIFATDDPLEVGATDLTICTIKTYDIGVIADRLRPLIGPQTALLPLQNGVETPDDLARHFGSAVLGGAVWVVSAVVEPGIVQQQSQFRRIVFGELDGQETPRLHTIHEALANSGATVEITGDIRKVLWTKLLFIASFSGMTSVTRAPAGPVMACAESRLLLERAMREVEAVARAKGFQLDDDVVAKTMDFCAKMTPETTSSMQRDVAAGRRLEYDAINGAVVRAGKATGNPTPVHEFCWTCLKVVDSMAR